MWFYCQSWKAETTNLLRSGLSCHFWKYSSMILRSDTRVTSSSLKLWAWTASAKSSAYANFCVIVSVILLVYKLKSVRTRTEPCSSPLFKARGLLVWPSRYMSILWPLSMVFKVILCVLILRLLAKFSGRPDCHTLLTDWWKQHYWSWVSLESSLHVCSEGQDLAATISVQLKTSLIFV